MLSIISCLPVSIIANQLDTCRTEVKLYCVRATRVAESVSIGTRWPDIWLDRSYDLYEGVNKISESKSNNTNLIFCYEIAKELNIASMVGGLQRHSISVPWQLYVLQRSKRELKIARRNWKLPTSRKTIYAKWKCWQLTQICPRQ